MIAPPPKYVAIAESKRLSQLAQIPEEWHIKVPEPENGSYMSLAKSCGILSQRELELTEKYDAFALREMLREGKLTSLELTLAICKRAAIAQQALKCLTEMFFQEAIERAKWLDSEFAKSGPIGPLHGLPVSIKDVFGYAGYDATCGMVHAANNPVKEHDTLVTLLLRAGAVLYCKTNIPQSLMTADSDNNLYGRVLNPLNVALTAGGSSGGEGALIAFGGSVLGVGTDIAGSIRIPAWTHGIYGLKPSVGLVPYYGDACTLGGGDYGVITVAGPLATSVRSIDMFMEAINEGKPWESDWSCIPMSWKLASPKKEKLAIGLLRGDGLVNLLPPISRALDETKAKLLEAGVEVVEMDWRDAFENYDIAIDLIQLDGGEGLQAALDLTGEPYINSVRHNPFPFPFRPAKSREEFFKAKFRRDKLARDWLNHWNSQKTSSGQQLDAIICPAAPFPPTKIDGYNYDNMYFLWNILDYPAVMFPVTKFSPEKDIRPIPAPISDYDVRVQEHWADPTIYRDIPINLQLVGRRLEESKLVQTLEVIDSIINGPDANSLQQLHGW